MTSWVFLYNAIFFEVIATACLRMSDGFSRWHYGVLSMILYCICFFLLSQSLKTIPVGVAYALWSGIGTVFVVTVGVLWFKEPLGLLKILYITMIVGGCIGLNLLTRQP